MVMRIDETRWRPNARPAVLDLRHVVGISPIVIHVRFATLLDHMYSYVVGYGLYAYLSTVSECSDRPEPSTLCSKYVIWQICHIVTLLYCSIVSFSPAHKCFPT